MYETEWQRAGATAGRCHWPCSTSTPSSNTTTTTATRRRPRLRAVARVAAAGLRRPGDLAARYGGEEIVLLMPDTDAAQAQQVVCNISLAISDLRIAHEASAVAPVLTVSAGGATLNGNSTETGADLFAAADALLYQAKKAGRNRVIWRE
jgi:diguanylate cyclase (GGDEF)-like protein